MYGLVTQTVLLKPFIPYRIPMAALFKKSFKMKHRSIWPRKYTQLSSVSGSSFLRFHDPLDLLNKKQIVFKPWIDDNDTILTEANTWIASSPISSLAITQRIIRWLRLCWKRVRNIFLVTIRINEVILRLLPLTILSPIAVFSAQVFGSHMISNLSWKYTIISIQQLGPVAIKFCQWAATRRDFFPPSLCDRLSILHDRGYPHSLQWTRRVLTNSFGDYERKGLVIEDVVGCGSAAQVYRGKLTVKSVTNNSKSTRDVAIKILHPRFQELIDRDLGFIEIIADFLHYLPFDHLKMLNLPRAVEDFSVVLRNQADLNIEAENLRQFRKNFYKNSQQTEEQSSIVFPQPIDDWISSNVIVEEYVDDAVPIIDLLLDSSQEGMRIRRELAGPLLRAFLKMIFLDNFIHGDLHPGNVLVKIERIVPISNPTRQFFQKFNPFNTRQYEEEIIVKRSIVFLDAGIAISLSKNDQRNLIDLFRAVVFNDGNRAGRLMVERAKYERCSQTPDGINLFAEKIEKIVLEFHDRRKEGLTLGAVRIGVLLTRVLDLCRIHGVEIDPAMASVVISTLVLEGLGRTLSPDLDLLNFARPFVLGRGVC